MSTLLMRRHARAVSARRSVRAAIRCASRFSCALRSSFGSCRGVLASAGVGRGRLSIVVHIRVDGRHRSLMSADIGAAGMLCTRSAVVAVPASPAHVPAILKSEFITAAA